MFLSSARRVEYCQSADEFYSTMGCLAQEMLEHNLIDSTDLMQVMYWAAEPAVVRPGSRHDFGLPVQPADNVDCLPCKVFVWIGG